MTNVVESIPNTRKYFENERDHTKFLKLMDEFQPKQTFALKMIKFKNEWLRIERTPFSVYLNLMLFEIPGGSNQLYLRPYPLFNDKTDNLTIARCIWHLRNTIRRDGEKRWR